MIRHDLVSAVRSLLRRPLFAAIKLLALALGFACYLTAHSIAEHVDRTDRQWANAGRIFAVSQAVTPPGAEVESSPTIGAISAPAVEYLKVDFPDVVIAATQTLPTPVRAAGTVQQSYNVLAVDPEFFRIFYLDVRGGTADALTAPGAVLLEAAAARELFGPTDPRGQTVQVGQADLTVAGVFQWPSPSHLGAGGTGKNIRAIIARDAISAVLGTTIFSPPIWSGTCCTTYLLPPAGGPTVRELAARLERFAAERVPPEFGRVRFALMPVGDVGRAYLNLGLFGGSLDLSVVTILNVFAALILAVACVDFANLAAAEGVARSREIGVRKTVGASRAQVAAQAMLEVGVLTFAALAIVLPLTLLIVAPIGRAIRLEIAVTDAFARADQWLGLLLVAVTVCVAAGAYPALILARLRPIFSLRTTSGRGGAGVVRTALTVAQFAAASFLLAAVAVMSLQRAALRDRLADPSEDPRLTVTFDLADLRSVDPRTVAAELGAHPAVTGLSGSMSAPFRRAVVTGIPPATIARSEDPNAERIPVQQRAVLQDYFAVAGIRLLAGRDFDEIQDAPAPPPPRSADDDEPAADLRVPPQRVVIDERLAARLGLTPQQAIGQVLYQSAQRPVVDRPGAPPRMADVLVPLEVVGVAAATPLEYMAEGPDAYVYVYQPFATTLILRIARDDVAGALAHVDATWRKFFPDRPIQRAFLDEAFDANFQMFNVLAMTFVGLSAIAVAIAAMGLFGIASFVVQRRAREIGIRKTLGATQAKVLGLMVWEFSKLVIVANAIAWPFAWLAARAYLDLFVQRIDLSFEPFLFALGVSLAIAWLAVGTHAFRAARVQPALVLRTE